MTVLRDSACDLCKMSGGLSERDICKIPTPPTDAEVMVVTSTPLSARARANLLEMLSEAGFTESDLYLTSAIKCSAWDKSPTKTDLKACRIYMESEISTYRPKFILLMGNEALYSVLGKSGITKYRGQTFSHGGAQVVPTISISAVKRNPGYLSGLQADLRYFCQLTHGESSQIAPADVRYVMSIDSLRESIRALRDAVSVTYDVETTGINEFADDAALVSVAMTLEMPDGTVTTYTIPLYHPQSPFRNSWQKVLLHLQSGIETAKKTIAHNGKFDARWMLRFGIEVRQTFDTMLAAHLLNENRPKGLKPLARELLGVEPWAIDTGALLGMELMDVLKYNALDTYYTFHLYKRFRKELQQQPRLGRIFVKLMMPASNALTHVENQGVFLDYPQLLENRDIAQKKVEEIEARLMEWVPEDRPYDVNFNTSNFLRWWIFEHLGLPVIRRGKDKEDGSPGNPSLAEDVMLTLKEMHEAPALLLERTTWYRYIHAFFARYEEQRDSNDRIHTTFKLAGTVTGRLSSGKVDEDKATGVRNIKGVNLQQVPRNPFVRGLFGAPDDWYFVEADYSQIELRVAAFIARERTMLSMYNQNVDIHMAMAQRMTGKPVSEISSEERKKAKAVNFGFLYGMGARKFTQTAFTNYGLHVSEEEALDARRAFFDQFDCLQRWHARQRALAKKYKRVESPMGRVRHLPDIDSPVKEVRAESERQSINSPVQAMASDMALLSLVRTTQTFQKLGIRAFPIGTVHDAVNFQVHESAVEEALPIIKDTMENLPLRQFGVSLDVPIVSDLKIGRRWGGATEIEPEFIYNYKLLKKEVLHAV